MKRAPLSVKGPLAALDVGSKKVCCMIAEANEAGEPTVLGIGENASRGVKAGAVVDMDAAEAAILEAVHGAEEMAGRRIEQVVVNLSGGFPASQSVGIEVPISGHEVGEGDLRQAVQRGHQYDGTGGTNGHARQLIHSIPIGYSIDGNRGIRDPIGMFGQMLSVNLHFVTAAAGAVRNLTTCVRRTHLEISGLVVSPYAAGLACLVEDEMELGVTVIDLGGGTTTIAVFFEGNVIYTDVEAIGGHHVTADLARGLSTTLAEAERLKTLYGHAIVAAADELEILAVPQVGEEHDGEPQSVPRSLLTGIIRPRLEEIFEHVRSKLEVSGFDKLAGRRVVLTGGGAQLPGIRELAGLILDKQVRIGRPIRTAGLPERYAGPGYATCTGLLTYALAADQAPLGSLPPSGAEAGLFGRVSRWLRDHL